MYMCVCVFTRVSRPSCGGSEGYLRESFFSSCHGGAGIELRLLFLGEKCLCCWAILTFVFIVEQQAEAQKSVWWNRLKSAEATWPHSSFYLFIFLFLCVWYVGIYVEYLHVGGYACTCLCVKNRDDVRCPWLTLALFTEPGSHWPCCLLICIL